LAQLELQQIHLLLRQTVLGAARFFLVLPSTSQPARLLLLPLAAQEHLLLAPPAPPSLPPPPALSRHVDQVLAALPQPDRYRPAAYGGEVCQHLSGRLVEVPETPLDPRQQTRQLVRLTLQ
jgi:hypothetical protein